jgi:hypothetical protein
MFGGCIYDIEHQNWNGGSFFFTKNSLPLLKYICEYYELNENIISKYYHKNGSQWYTDECIICDLKLIPEISHLFSSLTPEYNLGMTFFKTRHECAKKPIKALHVKLLNKDSKNEFDKISVGLNLIPQHLSEIINNYAH